MSHVTQKLTFVSSYEIEYNMFMIHDREKNLKKESKNSF